MIKNKKGFEFQLGLVIIVLLVSVFALYGMNYIKVNTDNTKKLSNDLISTEKLSEITGIPVMVKQTKYYDVSDALGEEFISGVGTFTRQLFDDNFDRPLKPSSSEDSNYFTFQSSDFEKGYIIEFVDDGVGLSVFISTRGGSRYHLFNYTSHEFSFLKNKHLLVPYIVDSEGNKINKGDLWYKNPSKDTLFDSFISSQRVYIKLLDKLDKAEHIQQSKSFSENLASSYAASPGMAMVEIAESEKKAYSEVSFLPFDSLKTEPTNIFIEWYRTDLKKYGFLTSDPQYEFIFNLFKILPEKYSSEFANRISQIEDKDNAEFIIIGVNDPSLTSLN